MEISRNIQTNASPKAFFLNDQQNILVMHEDSTKELTLLHDGNVLTRPARHSIHLYANDVSV